MQFKLITSIQGYCT